MTPRANTPPPSPCVHYSLSLSTGAAVCRLHNSLPPIGCRCPDYSPDYGAIGERAERWQQHLSDLAAINHAAHTPGARR